MLASSLLTFWAAAVALIVVPGADWAFTLDAGVRGRVLPAVAGLVVGYLVLTALVAAGVGVLVASSPHALTALTITGGVYLIWHGCRTCARPPDPPARSGTDPVTPARWTLARGIGVSALNPKALLMFLALLPQFTSSDADWPVTAQIVVLGTVFVATCALFYLTLGMLAGRALAARPTLGRGLGRIAGISMATVGALLVAERLAV